MSQDRVFSLLGDSNIQRNMNTTNCRDRPLMSGAQVIPCGRLDLLAEALRQIREASNVVLLSCITNFITCSAESVSSISNRIEPILAQFSFVLGEYAKEHPETLFLVAPPMYRSFPIWYRDGVSEVVQKFSSMMSNKPPDVLNVHLLPSFPTPSFEVDGIHLTPYSGLEFILHLFDSSNELIKTLTSTPEAVVIRNVESSRVLEDRMMVLEQDHRRLNRAFEDKTAEDAELADYHENTRYEDHFIVHGLAAIPKCDTKVWQDKAKRIIRDFLKKLLEREVKIVFVKNITGKGKDSLPRYQVQLESAVLSREIRDKFGTFFPGGKDSRPDIFKGVSVRNRLTHETRVRFTIMKILAQHWQASNPGSKIQCVNYNSRPTIKLINAEGVGDFRVREMTFIEAVRSLPVSFSPDELELILREVKPKWHGKLRSLFVVLSDDMIKKKFRNRAQVDKAEPMEATEADPENSDQDTNERPTFSFASRQSNKRGAPTDSSKSKSSKHHRK